MEKLLTVEEAAAVLHLKPRTVYDYLKAGKLRGSKIGKTWLIKESAIEEFVDAHEHKPSEGTED